MKSIKDNMKISIVTPSYNQGIYIMDAIESVLNQNYSNFEHIIIDGASTDNTLEIIKKYSHLKWISEPDDGQSDALNKGFNIASGDVIGWLNADDIYLSNAFNIIFESLNNNNIDAVYGNYNFIDESGKITKNLITQKSKKWMSLFYCFIPSTTFFFKRKIIDNNIYIDENFYISMDKEFFAHIYYSGYNIKKINNFFAHFRWHSNNKSLDTKEVKKIRLNEGIVIFNRYSKYSIPKNIFGLCVYYFLLKLVGFFRTICWFLKIYIYKS
jgi:glycosyltransferase involved in cell wall biosynthesis